MHATIRATDEFFDVVNDLDPELLAQDERVVELRERVRKLQENLRSAMKEISEQWEQRYREPALKAANRAMTELDSLQQALENYRNGRSAQAAKRTIARHHRRLTRIFADWSEKLARFKDVSRDKLARWRSLAPTNYMRNVFHVGNATWGVLVYQFLVERETAIVVMLLVMAFHVFIEVVRRLDKRLNSRILSLPGFQHMVRPREYKQLSSSTWYCMGALISVILFPKLAVCLAVLVLGLGDPAASLVGKRIRTPKLFGEKSVGGTLAFFLIATLSAAIYLAVIPHGHAFSVGALLGLAAVCGTAGALGELFARKLDDNFTVIIAAASAVAAYLSIFGL